MIPDNNDPIRRSLPTCQHGAAGSTGGVNPEPCIGECGKGAIAAWTWGVHEPLYLCEEHDEKMQDDLEAGDDVNFFEADMAEVENRLIHNDMLLETAKWKREL